MLSKGTVEILLDLVEIKLSAIIVQDREDIREVLKLKKRKKVIDKSASIYILQGALDCINRNII